MTQEEFAAIRRADHAAKEAYRQADRAFDLAKTREEQRILEDQCILKNNGVLDVKVLGRNEAEQKRTLALLLEESTEYRTARTELDRLRDEASNAALELQIALDAREDRKLAAREALADAITILATLGAVTGDSDAADAILDEIVEMAVDATVGIP